MSLLYPGISPSFHLCVLSTKSGNLLDYLSLSAAINYLFMFFLLCKPTCTQTNKKAALLLRQPIKLPLLCGSIQAITLLKQAQQIFISVASVITSLVTLCYCPGD